MIKKIRCNNFKTHLYNLNMSIYQNIRKINKFMTNLNKIYINNSKKILLISLNLNNQTKIIFKLIFNKKIYNLNNNKTMYKINKKTI